MSDVPETPRETDQPEGAEEPTQDDVVAGEPGWDEKPADSDPA